MLILPAAVSKAKNMIDILVDALTDKTSPCCRDFEYRLQFSVHLFS